MRKYLVENGHEAIISTEQFEMAQQELKARRKEKRQHSSKSIFTSKLICGDCGCFYGSKVWHSTDKYRSVVWQCNNKFKADKKCTTPHCQSQLKRDKRACGRFLGLNYNARPSSLLYSFGLFLFKRIFILSFLNQLRYLSIK